MIETMAAMLILAMVCIAFSRNQTASIQLVKASRFRDRSIMLAKQRMAEIDFAVNDKGIESIKDEEQGEFDQEKYPTFKWKSTKSKIPAPDFNALIALGSGGEEGAEASADPAPQQGGFEGPMKMVTDLWGKSIFQLALEIEWNEGEHPKSYRVLTHYIATDATKQIQGLIGSMTGGAAAATGATPSEGETP
jgi:general secretion pathway protein I